MKKKSNLKKYLAEGLLIVFSVLFALFINKAVEDYKTNQNKNIAIKSITKELYRNLATLEKWKVKHISIRNRISSMVENKDDSLNVELKRHDYFDFMVLTNNQPLVNSILSNTAWESSKTTGIISEFDYEMIQELTFVYNVQELLTERTIMKILDYLDETDTHNMENLNSTLVQFQLRFWGLTGQEETMIFLYKKAINKLEE